jgi:hypothetical protein
MTQTTPFFSEREAASGVKGMGSDDPTGCEAVCPKETNPACKVYNVKLLQVGKIDEKRRVFFTRIDHLCSLLSKRRVP